jgi:hypothetical protein
MEIGSKPVSFGSKRQTGHQLRQMPDNRSPFGLETITE